LTSSSITSKEDLIVFIFSNYLAHSLCFYSPLREVNMDIADTDLSLCTSGIKSFPRDPELISKTFTEDPMA
jgi:hypothetical protein